MKNIKNNLTVCVIGGTGFLGSHLLKLLVKEEVMQVRILSRNVNAFTSPSQHIQRIQGSLLDKDSLVRFLVPDAIVINLAYLNTGSKEDNLKAVEHLADACVTVGIQRLIHCSSAAVFGHVNDDVVTEMIECNPITDYESMKLEVEHRLLQLLNGRCTVFIVRPTAIFGEGGKNLIKLAHELLVDGRFMHSVKKAIHGKRRFNLVYVENVVAAIWFLACINSNLSSQIFLISDDDVPENNYYDVFRLLAEYLHIRIWDVPCILLPASILSGLLRLTGRSNVNPRRVYSSAKLLQLGFRRSVAFEEGIRRFASWYSENR